MQIYTKPAEKPRRTACKSLKNDIGEGEDMLAETIKPDRDSQFRLLPCNCGGEPVYQRHQIPTVPYDVWSVVCPACQRGTTKYYKVRRDAQLEWNKGMGVK